MYQMEQSNCVKNFGLRSNASESRSEKTFAKRVENDLRAFGTTSSNRSCKAEKAYANTGNVLRLLMAILLSLFYLVHIWYGTAGKILPRCGKRVIHSAGDTILDLTINPASLQSCKH